MRGIAILWAGVAGLSTIGMSALLKDGAVIFPVVSNPWWNGFVWGVGAASLLALTLVLLARSDEGAKQ